MNAGPLLLAIMGTLAVVLLAGLMSFSIFLGLSRGREGRRKLPEASQEPLWASRVAALEVKVDALPGLWEQERKRAEQARDRERYYASKSGRRRDPEDDEGEESPELPEGDAGAGAEQGVLPLRTGVGNGAPSLEPDHLARARQMGYPWSFLRQHGR